MPPNFDPAQALDDDQVPITTPIARNQVGGFVGAPTNPDPAGTAAVVAAARQDQADAGRAWLATHDPNTGAPLPPQAIPPAAIPGTVTPADAGAPLVDAAAVAPGPGDSSAIPGTAPGQPGAVTAPAASAAPPAPAGTPEAGKPRSGVGHVPGGPLPADAADRLENEFREGASAQAGAAKDVGESQQSAAEGNAEAIGQQAELRRQQAADLAAEQQYVHDRQQALEQEDARNLKDAQEKVIPDFWAGREGQLVGSAITVALSGAAGALLGSTHNQALDAITHNVDTYYSREKEKIDNLYKYAELKGKMNDQTRARYATQLTDLMQQHAYTLAAAADRVQQVQTEGQGSVDKAKADALAAGLKAKAAEGAQAADGLRLQVFDANSGRMKAQADLIRANADAAKARAEANKVKGDAAVEKEIKPISSEFDKDEARLKGNSRTPGILLRQQDIREIGNNLRQAIASGDAQSATAAAIAAKEKISRLNTGAAPSGHVLEFLNSLSGNPEQTKEKIAHIMGNPKTSEQMLGGLVKLLDQSDESVLKQTDKERQNLVTKYLGPNGIARTPAQRAHVMGRMGGMFSQTTTRTAKGEVPRYAEGGADAGGTSAAPEADPNADAKAWVTAHPGDPRAAQIRQRLGM